MSVINRTELYRLIDELPESVLTEVARFLEFIRFKLNQEVGLSTPFVPVALGGLWQGVAISDDDIARVRQEMGQGFGETVE